MKKKHYSGFSDIESWRWFRTGELKKEGRGLIIAAQKHSLRTSTLKPNIDKSTSYVMCKVCKQSIVHHIVRGC